MPPGPLDDALSTEELAVNASMGDVDALADLYERFADRVVRYVASRTRTQVATAEDIAADTWVNVMKSMPRYESSASGFEAWLFTIARNTSAKHFKRTKGTTLALTSDMLDFDRTNAGVETPAEAVERRHAAERVVAEVHALPRAQRECVHLRFVVQLDLAETARVMGKNVNTIKQLQYRALRSLARRLGGDVGLLTESAAARTTVLAHADPATLHDMYRAATRNGSGS